MSLSLDDLLAGLPAGREVSAQEVAALRGRTGPGRRVLVVLDDDPTGTQSVADLPVLTSWTTDALEWALSQATPAVYVLTNTRSLAPEDAERRNREVARNAYVAAGTVGVEVAFVSRSDSTLRGHFPLEVDVLAEEVLAHTGRAVDGVVVVPAFGDAGRVTVGSVHYAGSPEEGWTPVGETEFARDHSFGYRSSDLRDWVAEKTGGRVPAEHVAALDLATLRTDPVGSAELLRSLRDAQPVVVDVVEENDLRLLALALDGAERDGARLLYRVGPPFVRAVVGQEPRAPLDADDLAVVRAGGRAEGRAGGLVVVGSHVETTTRQLEHLLAEASPTRLELDVPSVLGEGREEHLTALVEQAVAALTDGDVVLSTSREVVTGEGDEPLAVSRSVSDALVDVVRRVVAQAPPRFVVAKGGITSSDVASRGLGIERAVVRGPMLPGIVSLWEPVEGPARGVPFVVFAGNVGGPTSLAEVVRTLSR